MKELKKLALILRALGINAKVFSEEITDKGVHEYDNIFCECSKGMVHFVYYFVMITLELTAVKLIYNRTMVPHSETIAKARRVKYDIETNQKKIKRIEKGIRKDKNEDMYGLSDFDYRINEINDSIRNIEDAKAKAIEQFNATTRTDIIAEIRGRNAGTLEQLKSQVAVCEQEMARLDSRPNVETNSSFAYCPDGKFYSAKCPNSTKTDDIDREWLNDNIYMRIESMYLIAAEAA